MAVGREKLRAWWISAAVLASAGCLAGQSAEAKIRCNGPFQIVGDKELATPYCADAYLARIAGEYGLQVSAKQMREDFGRKQEVCRLVGQDIRVREYCAQFVPQARGRGGL